MSAHRRKVIGMAGGIAATSGVAPVLLRGHPRLGAAWVAALAVLIVLTVAELAKLKREERG